mmetsp:Transcript_15908/g.60607  ORF Transcript_15908/g.60607 Transcript_15908/m.60607 type:complete len:460 (+) Transcript_15908:372-1751(+)
MALCFSLNHGTVSACIPLAAGEFGSTLGSYQLGTLYLFYTMTALTVSTAIVNRLGQKGALVGGLLLYCVYVVSFLIAREAPPLRWPVALFGAVTGGIAAGFLWTAQGGYFTTCATAYAYASGSSTEAATSRLSGIFAVIYLGFEVVLKLLSSLIQFGVCGDKWDKDFLTGSCGDDGRKDSGILTVYIVYTAVAIVSTVGMAFISVVREDDGGQLRTALLPRGRANADDGNGLTGASGDDAGPEQDDLGAEDAAESASEPSTLVDRASEAIRFLATNTKMQLMVWTNFTFGFLAAFINSYVVADVIPDGQVGYYVAIIPLVATFMSLPLGYLSEKTGSKVYAMFSGQVAFLAFILAFVVLGASVLGKAYVLAPLFVIYGLGRAMWEGPNKAVFADFFAASSGPAFANLILQNGGASALAFFLYPSLSVATKEYLCLVISAIAIPAYLAADRIHVSEQSGK